MTKGNRTTSTARRATVAKATKPRNRPSCNAVQWGYENGHHVVMKAPGKWELSLPAGRWTTLAHMLDAALGK
jgi:hypothetical protein